MALNARRSPKPVETVPISINVQDQQQEVRVGIAESESKRSESGEGFEILDDTEIAEVKGLGFEVSLNQVRDSEGDLII
jgi:hypothetical protein